MGESHGWPNKGWNMGVFDISLEPKPTAYYIKSYFQEDQPRVHVSVYEGASAIHWNDVNLGSVHLSESWNRQKDEKLVLYAFSNADEVELRLNGNAIARQSNQRQISKQRNRFIFEN
ncbi:MAG: beta-galactosidase, partial [Bacteroidales bacterium]|nr:beta-galactosidase [Bacteroidales bacterium]